jgi:hypothetical protein
MQLGAALDRRRHAQHYYYYHPRPAVAWRRHRFAEMRETQVVGGETKAVPD